MCQLVRRIWRIVVVVMYHKGIAFALSCPVLRSQLPHLASVVSASTLRPLNILGFKKLPVGPIHTDAAYVVDCLSSGRMSGINNIYLVISIILNVCIIRAEVPFWVVNMVPTIHLDCQSAGPNCGRI